MGPDRIYVNTRALSAPLTGVQRYTSEVLARLGNRISRVSPAVGARGVTGHAWEQAVLPLKVRGGLLWSPANTGPVSVRRQVLTLHDMGPFDHPEWMSARFARWYRTILPVLVTRCRRVITDSEFTKSRIIEWTGVADERVVVVQIAADSRFEPSAADAFAASEIAWFPEGRYVLTVGSVEPRKNLPRLLQAWEQALPSIPDDVSLVIAGGMGGRRVFGDFTLGALPERVTLVGRVSDEVLPMLYARALAFAYPSIYEGFGLPPLEAMASGVPVIAGNRTALPEVVGDAGMLVDPYDVEAIANALVRMVTAEDLRADLRRRGLARAAAFSWDRAATEIWRVLQAARS